MLDQIIGLVKDQAMSQISGQADVPAENAEALAGAAGESITEGLQSQLSSGNLEGLTSLLGGQAGDLAGNSMVQGMISNFAGKATGLGLSSGAASSLGGGMIPTLIQTVISKFTSTDSADSAFDVNSLLETAGKAAMMNKAKDMLGGGLGNLLK